MNKRANFRASWDPVAIRIGQATVLPIAVLCFLPSIYLYIFHGLIPPLDVMLRTWGLILVVFAAFYIIEPMSYYPVLGLAGTYMAFLSGNISNMRLPCSAIAQEAVGVLPETPEAEIISTLGISGSILTNIIGVTLAVLLGSTILSLLPESLVQGIKLYAAPAIIGAVFGQFALMSMRTGIIALVIPTLLYLIGTTTGVAFIMEGWVIIVVTIVLTVCLTRFFYLREKKRIEEV